MPVDTWHDRLRVQRRREFDEARQVQDRAVVADLARGKALFQARAIRAVLMEGSDERN